jgi:hypothetical protein
MAATMPRQEGDADAVQPPGQDIVRGFPQGVLILCQCASSNPLIAYSPDPPMIAIRLSVICCPFDCTVFSQATRLCVESKRISL